MADFNNRYYKDQCSKYPHYFFILAYNLSWDEP